MRRERLSVTREFIILTKSERSVQPTLLRLAQLIQVSGRVVSEMALAHKSGKTLQSTSVNGKKIKHMVGVNSYTLTVIFMKDSGQMIRLMDLEFTSM